MVPQGRAAGAELLVPPQALGHLGKTGSGVVGCQIQEERQASGHTLPLVCAPWVLVTRHALPLVSTPWLQVVGLSGTTGSRPERSCGEGGEGMRCGSDGMR